MQSSNSINEPYTLAIIIPNVSHLLIYKDHWNRASVMRKVIAEVLKNKLYSRLYFGKNDKSYCESDFPEYSDCAIINIQITGLSWSGNEAEVPEIAFIHEIQNKRNILKFCNTILSAESNVSCIDIKIIRNSQKATRNLS